MESNDYGTISSSRTSQNNTNQNSSDQERIALISKPDGSAFGRSFRNHMNATVSETRGDLALLACYLITGLLDSSSIFTWGSFVSMQTGNTVYLGSGVVAPDEDNKWLRALVSLVSFFLGSFCFSRYHRTFGGRKRWVLVSTYSFQLVLMIAAAVIITVGPRTSPKGKGPLDVWVAVPLALIAFQAAGQAFVSRVLKFGSLTSVVLTSIYLDLFSDEQLFAGITQNAERNRRIAAPLLLLAGAMIGGGFAHSDVGLPGALWTAVIIKFLVVLTWCFWASEKEDE